MPRRQTTSPPQSAPLCPKKGSRTSAHNEPNQPPTHRSEEAATLEVDELEDHRQFVQPLGSKDGLDVGHERIIILLLNDLLQACMRLFEAAAPENADELLPKRLRRVLTTTCKGCILGNQLSTVRRVYRKWFGPLLRIRKDVLLNLAAIAAKDAVLGNGRPTTGLHELLQRLQQLAVREGLTIIGRGAVRRQRRLARGHWLALALVSALPGGIRPVGIEASAMAEA